MRDRVQIGSRMTWTSTFGFLLAFASAVAISAGLIVLLRPLLVRIALAKPNARSSHKDPTPQGGGIAVVIAIFGGVPVALAFSPVAWFSLADYWPVFLGMIILTVIGAIDDVIAVDAVLRLVLQFVAAAMIVTMLPTELRLVPTLPILLERVLVLVGGVYLVNVVNFMDGIDWMSVAEIVPITAGLALLSSLGALSTIETAFAVALCGAMLGFAPFNRPVAKLFLGDVGSLPIGLLLFWLLLQLAGHGHVVAALLLPLYYVADATITLIRRLANGENIMQAHRAHFYQRALDRGFSVPQVLYRVFAVNVGLVVLAIAAVWVPSPVVQIGTLTLGTALVAGLLINLSQGTRSQSWEV